LHIQPPLMLLGRRRGDERARGFNSFEESEDLNCPVKAAYHTAISMGQIQSPSDQGQEEEGLF